MGRGGYSRYCADALFAGHVARNFPLVFELESTSASQFEELAVDRASRESGLSGEISSTLSSTGLISRARIRLERYSRTAVVGRSYDQHRVRDGRVETALCETSC